MTDYTDPTRSTLRLSDAEREVAVSELSAAQAAGRLTPDEFAERAAAARHAVTRGDLAPLFRDLPGSDAPSAVPHSAASAGSHPTPLAGESASWAANGPRPGRRPRGGTAGATVLALTPFIALILFFVTSGIWGWGWAWLWFLLVPIVGVIIWGPSGDGGKRQ